MVKFKSFSIVVLCIISVISLTGMKWGDGKKNKRLLDSVKRVGVLIVGKEGCNVEYSRKQAVGLLGMIGVAMTWNEDKKRIKKVDAKLKGWNIREKLAKEVEIGFNESTGWELVFVNNSLEIEGEKLKTYLVNKEDYLLLKEKLGIDHLLQIRVKEYGIWWEGLWGTKAVSRISGRLMNLGNNRIFWDKGLTLHGDKSTYEELVAGNADLLRAQLEKLIGEMVKRMLGDFCFIDYKGIRSYRDEEKAGRKGRFKSRRRGRR